LALLESARREGLPITVETCPHYLHFSPADVLDGATQFKCAPPFRGGEHREKLWEGLRCGTIDTIGSDHSPCPPEMKHLDSGDFMAAWGGIGSVELTLPVVWTGAVERSIAIEQVFQWLSTRPAELFGLADRKGRIAVGCDADLVVFDPDLRWSVVGLALHQRHKVSPYDGVRLRGRVHRTYLRGSLMILDSTAVESPRGKLLAAANRRPEA